MKTKIVTTIALLLLFSYSAVIGADWAAYSTEPSGNVRYYNRGSIVYVSDNLVRVWEKVVYTPEGIEKLKKRYVQEMEDEMFDKVLSKKYLLEKGYDRLAEAVALREINCKNRTDDILSLTFRERNGEVLDSYTYDTMSDSYVEPGTIQEDLYNKVCRQGKVKR